jgi:hypothetical protein
VDSLGEPRSSFILFYFHIFARKHFPKTGNTGVCNTREIISL